MSANFRRVKQQSASAALAAHGLGPWAVWIWNSQFRAHPEMEPWKSLMPRTMRPFHIDHGSSLAGVEGRGKAFWQANEEFIWNVLWCWEDLRALQKATRENSGGHTDRSYSFSPVRVLYQHSHQLVSEMIRALSTKILGWFLWMSELSVWVNISHLTVRIAWENRADSTVSSCAQQFVRKHATKRETANMREHQRKWFRLTREFSAGFVWWQDVTVLRVYR